MTSDLSDYPSILSSWTYWSRACLTCPCPTDTAKRALASLRSGRRVSSAAGKCVENRATRTVWIARWCAGAVNCSHLHGAVCYWVVWSYSLTAWWSSGLQRRERGRASSACSSVESRIYPHFGTHQALLRATFNTKGAGTCHLGFLYMTASWRGLRYRSISSSCSEA